MVLIFYINDIIFFFRSLVGKKLVTKKLTTKTNSLPRWAERVRDIFLAFCHSARAQYRCIDVQQQNRSSWQNYMKFTNCYFKDMMDHPSFTYNSVKQL